ncbi:MAG: branched-chain amino acid ABC transporter permease [Ferrovibrio sp.]|uniref:branched-chain amino acid ABC transporter permease n=1 Tax=Ferrovibrio sp. TaxID=1917215 RepID=UPI0026067E12|nr:branched-chain amino acid ABC transporter permease [Ferrovibrio sp.]MCW0235016.1 branched-chain amino acid ABC transporter permease [Ferrovibrio sp.]
MTAHHRHESIIWLGAAVAAAVVLFAFGPGIALLGTEIMIMALFACSLNLIMSYGGMVSFGHAAYFGLGAYGFALAIVRFDVPPALALACGPILALLAALLFGSLCVRLSHIYFAMLTLACAEITYAILFQAYDFTGGDTGLTRFVAPRFGLTPQLYGLVVLVVLLLSLLILRRLVASPLGLAIRSVGEDPYRTAALGYNPRRVQLAAFVVAGGFAGLAGMLFSVFHGNAFPDYAGLAFTLDALVMVVIGGLHSFVGPIYGAIIYLLMKTFISRYVGEWELVVGIVLMAVVLGAPRGLAGLAARLGIPSGGRKS